MTYPALDVWGVDPELLVAAVHDFSPSAVDEGQSAVTIFFTDAEHRARAARAVAEAWPAATIALREVDDEGWAQRSQESLTPVTVGRVTVAPPWFAPAPQSPPARNADATRREHVLTIVIAPSMGFGTGHHATTRLCLAALQTLDLTGGLFLDVGTGSGILALVARALGASEAVGVDCDPDAVRAAEENLAANPAIDHVRFLLGDLRTANLPLGHTVSANLTGALLINTAPLLSRSVRPGGALVLSGLLSEERADVVSAFADRATLTWEAEEDGWFGLVLRARDEKQGLIGPSED